jgi:hypothetical protein
MLLTVLLTLILFLWHVDSVISDHNYVDYIQSCIDL